MKRSLFIIIGIFIVMISVILIVFQEGNVTLVAEKNGSATNDDFLLHLRIQGMDDGIRVLNSLQYIGDGSVEIYHQTPLISVSLLHKNHDYTGSLISKTLSTSTIYHQDPIYLEVFEKGKYNLFVQAKFWVNGEVQTINHIEELHFQ